MKFVQLPRDSGVAASPPGRSVRSADFPPACNDAVLLLDICALRQEFNPDGVKAPDDLLPDWW
jgi:hypothetical protein